MDFLHLFLKMDILEGVNVSSVNKVFIMGRLGNDPEMKTATSGNPVANFSVATSDKWTDKGGNKQEKTEWHRVTIWGNGAMYSANYLKKGSLVWVEGKLQTRSWEDKTGNKKYTTEIIADRVSSLERKPADDSVVSNDFSKVVHESVAKQQTDMNQEIPF